MEGWGAKYLILTRGSVTLWVFRPMSLGATSRCLRALSGTLGRRPKLPERARSCPKLPETAQ
eukprot:6947301-Alexandrium_andersonii.AAC.1